MEQLRLQSLQAVVFDMDGLMFDSERYIQTAWNQAGTILGYGTLGDHIEKTLGFNGTKRREFSWIYAVRTSHMTNFWNFTAACILTG